MEAQIVTAKVFDIGTGKWIQDLEKISLPAYKRDTEDVQTALGKRKIGLGIEQPVIKIEDRNGAELFRKYFHQESGIRIVASLQHTNGTVEVHEIEARGEAFEIGRGDIELRKMRGKGSTDFTCSFYREKYGNKTIFEVDYENNSLIVDDVDLMSVHNNNVA